MAAKVLTESQIDFYKKKAQEAANARGIELLNVEVTLTDRGKVKVISHYAANSIERVRRVTGYFCKLSNCNEAKMAEIRDRKTHFLVACEG